MARPSNAATTSVAATRPSSTSVTSTVTVDNNPQQAQTLVLRLKRKEKKVTWKDGTIDNEFMQKKSSKKCCIFHKDKPFDDDYSDDDDHHHDHNHDHESDGACSSKANGGD